MGSMYQRLLVKPGTPEQRNTGTPEQHHSGTRNTGTLKILNLLKFREKKYRGCESIAAIIMAIIVKPGTTEHGTPEQHHSGTRNTGTLKILNLLKIRKKNTGGCESIAAIIIA